MHCKICKTEYDVGWSGSPYLDECECGQNCPPEVSLWKFDGLRALRNALRYRVVRFMDEICFYLTKEKYK